MQYTTKHPNNTINKHNKQTNNPSTQPIYHKQTTQTTNTISKQQKQTSKHHQHQTAQTKTTQSTTNNKQQTTHPNEISNKHNK